MSDSKAMSVRSAVKSSIKSSPSDASSQLGTGSLASVDSSVFEFGALEQSHAFQLLADNLILELRRSFLQTDTQDGWNAVVLRQRRDKYVVSPEVCDGAILFGKAIARLNCTAAATLSSIPILCIAELILPNTREFQLSPADKLQVVETMNELATCRKAQGVCFIRSEAKLIVWTDTVGELMGSARAWQSKIVDFIRQYSSRDEPESSKPETTSQKLVAKTKGPWKWLSKKAAPTSLSGVSEKVDSLSSTNDLEGGRVEPERRVEWLAQLYCGLALALNIFVNSILVQNLVFSALEDHGYMRLAVLICIPFLMCVLQFLFDNIIGTVAQILMPINQMSRNSVFYSGQRPVRLSAERRLPEFTVQLPVYKESLEGVLAPTIASLNKAIATYELQGGCANILVSEDGMQILSEEEQEARKDYYDRNNVSWVARPGHGKDGYIRKGRFKKASNLNFTCGLSMRVEDIMDELRAEMKVGSQECWDEEDEKELYDRALDIAVKETEGKAWVSGNIRLGQYILIIDSDTRVPQDCFLDAASELEAYPEVAIIQHRSGVMYVADHFFERMIGFFTFIVNYSISWCVSNGAIAPFVGHNAFLRWSALKSVQFVDDDGERCIWSSCHVSEDFDMALRLLMKGFLVRWATYSNNEFLEGVSLTPEDEINRWQKYAYGCSELVFNPLRYWITRGPFTKLFRTFLFSNCITTYKINACSYIFSYWAIAAAVPLTPVLTVVNGLFGPTLDTFVLQMFGIWLTCLVIFTVFGNLGLVISRWRSRDAAFHTAAWEHISWIPALIIFFGGLSYHIFVGLMAHIFGYNMTWSATIKDVEDSNFYAEFPAMLKRFWHCFLYSFIVIAGSVVLFSGLMPFQWRIEGITMVFPAIWFGAMHILYPIALNPWMMRFSF